LRNISRRKRNTNLKPGLIFCKLAPPPPPSFRHPAAAKDLLPIRLAGHDTGDNQAHGTQNVGTGRRQKPNSHQSRRWIYSQTRPECKTKDGKKLKTNA
jgi:hypothetical protein